jgi:Ca2+-binding EF-hand superfamily protein
MKDIFDSIDEDNSGELSVEEFGKALHAFITKAGGEDSDAE